jgi:hypothetical protein
MSDYYYQLIPTIPDHVPDDVARKRARERFELFVGNAAGVNVEVREHVEFVPCMGNFESVSCPVCGTRLDDDWWGRAMDAAYGEQGFGDLRVTVPCCGAATSLNDLIYHFPQGFARFVLSAFEPHVSDLEDWQVHELEEIIGCKLRKIWVHM